MAAYDSARLEQDARIYEYTSAANPDMAEVPHLALPSAHHERGESSRPIWDAASVLFGGIGGRGGTRREACVCDGRAGVSCGVDGPAGLVGGPPGGPSGAFRPGGRRGAGGGALVG